MTSLKEINQIREILSNYKNLGVGYLVEEEHLHAQKVGKFEDIFFGPLKCLKN